MIYTRLKPVNPRAHARQRLFFLKPYHVLGRAWTLYKRPRLWHIIKRCPRFYSFKEPPCQSVSVLLGNRGIVI